jgi:methyl-accepting chemotaxis protein
MNEIKRKRYLIDRKFQITFILKFCSLLLLGAVLSIIILYALSSTSTSVFFANSRIMVKNTSQFILPLLVKTSVIVTILIGLIAGVMLLLQSHKISGPLFRLKREIEQLADGHIPQDFNIRSNDQLQGIAESFRNSANRLNALLAELKTHWLDLKNGLADVLKQPGENNEKIRKIVGQIEEKLRHFKI